MPMGVKYWKDEVRKLEGEYKAKDNHKVTRYDMLRLRTARYLRDEISRAHSQQLAGLEQIYHDRFQELVTGRSYTSSELEVIRS